MKKCKTCKFWERGHNGVYNSDNYGTCCHPISEGDSFNDFIPLCEGCVDARDKIDNFEFVTGENFGCVNHKNK